MFALVIDTVDFFFFFLQYECVNSSTFPQSSEGAV